MTLSYDVFVGAFLSKITDYDFLSLVDSDRNAIVDEYLKASVSNTTFRKVCSYDFVSTADDESRVFSDIDIDEDTLDEIVEIVSDGMIVQWLKHYIYHQEILQNVMNTRDYSLYSPAELILRVGNAYNEAKKSYIQSIREYSYNHGDLTSLHI